MAADPVRTPPAEPSAPQSSVSTRWRIVGWIVLTTGLALLAVTVTTRSVLLTQVAERANAGIVQEIDEFRTFSSEGVDPTTARPFTSLSALIDRYLSRQTPATGEAIIGVAGEDASSGNVRVVDNTRGDVGRLLADDPARLQQLLAAPEDSGVVATPDGDLRWGRTTAQAPAGVDPDTGTLIVAQFVAADIEDVEREILVLFGVAAGGLLLTAGIAWLVAGRILHPLRVMRRAASTITERDLSARVPVEGNDEVAHLAVTVNGMLDRVQRAQDEQQHFALEAKRYLAEPRDRVHGAIGVLSDGQRPDEERQRAARTAGRELEHMRRTMDDLEILARRHYPDFLVPRHVSLEELLVRVYSEAVRSYPTRRWELEDTAAGRAWVDPRRIADAMRQLTENAVDHTGRDETVRIGSALVDSPGGPRARLWVANPGPPLQQEDAERLFEEYRGGADQDQYGMGFGLAVVRAVADAHLGSAWVESDPQDGTRFGLDLPVAALAPGDDEGSTQLGREMLTSLGEES